MSASRELLGVALGGLKARASRTVMLMLGPLIGVSAMVAAVGLTDSAKGDLKTKLANLGTNLLVVDAAQAFGGGAAPELPDGAIERTHRLATVDQVSAITELSGVVTLPYADAESYFQSFPVPVLAVDATLPTVLNVQVTSGRWINESDIRSEARSVVLGTGLATQYAYLPGETRTVLLNNINYAVVGVLDKVELRPELNDAAFISPAAAERDFVDDQNPNRLFVTAKSGKTTVTQEALPTAVVLGGTEEVTVSVPSEALRAQAEADKTVQRTAFFAGVLALLLGAVGIANVMSISVIQRSGEIGIRRALGHTRSLIAGQFLLEAIAVGILGGVCGAALGVAIVAVVSKVLDWTMILQYPLLPLWIAIAVVVSTLAGLYPAMKAARLEPLETLRLG
jgi:putative ABC transport system permease protein